MAKHLSINVGFITNSSSVVHHFPREVLNDPRVQGFLKVFEIENGFIGGNMWHRGDCDTFAITREQKLDVQNALRHSDFGSEYSSCGPGIDTESDEIVIAYGDEYSNLVHALTALIQKVLEEQGVQPEYGSQYN